MRGNNKMRHLVFSGSMPQAIRENRKTETRRVMIPQPVWDGFVWTWKGGQKEYRLPNSVSLDPRLSDLWMACPYGTPGESLALLGAWAVASRFDKVKPSRLRRNVAIWTAYDGTLKPRGFGKTRSARFTPRFLYVRFPQAIITRVYAERVKEIFPEQAILEGCSTLSLATDLGVLTGPSAAITRFRQLWDSLHAKRGFGWDANPAIWVIEFEKIGATNGQA